MGADGCHNSNVPPPFLTKTYEMVDDPTTDEIVSWSDNNSSFIVWNVADFTKDLLPQYFKHNNFSSFVRQLNTYGFHKIDPDRQEFANEGFSKGNKEGLKNIHRRKPTASHAHSSHPQKELPLVGCSDAAHTELEEEIRNLKREKGNLVNELMSVQQVQQNTETELEALAKRLQALEKRQQNIIAFLACAMRHPSFALFVQQNESFAFTKKRRLLEQEALTGIGDSWGEEGTQLVRYYSEDSGDRMLNAHHHAKSDGVSGVEFSYEQVLKQLAVSTLDPSDETSPVSQTSGVCPWDTPATSAEHATNGDSAAGNGEAVEGSDWGGSRDLTAWASHVDSGKNIDHDEQKQVIAPKKPAFEAKQVNVSNDHFWESMLTENPRLPDRDSDDCRSDGHAHERWFL